MSTLAFGLALWAAPPDSRERGLDPAPSELASAARGRADRGRGVRRGASHRGRARPRRPRGWRGGTIAWPVSSRRPSSRSRQRPSPSSCAPGDSFVAPRWLPPHVPLEVGIALRALGARIVTVWVAGAFLSARGAFREEQRAVASFRQPWRKAWRGARGDAGYRPMRRCVGDPPTLLALGAIAPLGGTAAGDRRCHVARRAVCSHHRRHRGARRQRRRGGGGVAPAPCGARAAAMRRGISRTPASGPVLVEGAFASGLVALVPWLGLVALAAVPFALRLPSSANARSRWCWSATPTTWASRRSWTA